MTLYRMVGRSINSIDDAAVQTVILVSKVALYTQIWGNTEREKIVKLKFHLIAFVPLEC